MLLIPYGGHDEIGPTLGNTAGLLPEPKGVRWPDVIRLGFTPPDVAGLPLPEIARVVTEAVASHLETSPHTRNYLTKLPKGPGTFCPDDPIEELVSYIARMVGVKGINKSDPLVNWGWMSEIMAPVFRFGRQALMCAIRHELDSGRLESSYRDFVLTHYGFFQLADQVNALFLALFRKLVVQYQSLTEDERKQFDADMAEQLPEYDYTIYDIGWDNGHYEAINRQPWAVAFPDEIQAILITIRHLLADLPGDEAALCEYFSRLLTAYECGEINELEERWAAVDEAWVQLGSQLPIVPVHGIETYNCPYAVQPEFRLEIRTNESQDEIIRAKQATVEVARQLGLSPEMITRIERRLENTDVGVFISVCRAGFTLGFPIAGQSAPNRQGVQDNIGARIFIDPARERAKVNLHYKLADAHCDPTTAQRIRKLLTTFEMRLHTITHECAHPLGRTAEIDASLGEMRNELEEAKASLIGMLATDARDPSPEGQWARVAHTAARCIRFFQESNTSDPSVAPYVRENKVAAVTLMDAGILALTENGIHIDWEMAETGEWRRQLVNFGSRLLAVYANQNPDQIKLLAADYYGGNPDLQRLIDWCQREVTETAAA